MVFKYFSWEDMLPKIEWLHIIGFLSNLETIFATTYYGEMLMIISGIKYLWNILINDGFDMFFSLLLEF